jgi:tRNA (guanine-N7-)-methyltransferase
VGYGWTDGSCVIESIPAGPRLLELPRLFERDAPLQVDLGCGDGSFLQALAAQRPDRNFLGIERLLHRVCSSGRKAAQLPNVRIIRGDTMFLLRHWLPPRSVEVFYLLFPDPWPKRRHHRRRLVTTQFLEAIWTGLTNSGSLFIATDHDDYFGAIRQLLSRTPGFVPTNSHWKLPVSSFEKRFTVLGTRIHRVKLRKVSPVR